MLLELYKFKFWLCILFVYSQKNTANIAQQLQARKKKFIRSSSNCDVYVYQTKQKAAATYSGYYSFWFTILIDFLFLAQ